jgi:hypothetical protein
VNALVRDFLDDYADERAKRREAMRRLLELAERSNASSGPQGRTWRREDLYERR